MWQAAGRRDEVADLLRERDALLHQLTTVKGEDLILAVHDLQEVEAHLDYLCARAEGFNIPLISKDLVIEDDYLASGAFGIVCKAELLSQSGAPAVDTPLVAKLFNQEGKSKTIKAEIWREAQLLADAAGIAPRLHGMIEDHEGRLCGLLLEEVAGGSVDAFIKPRRKSVIGAQDKLDLLQLFYSCVEAVGELHDRGIAHGDLKSDNFLLATKWDGGLGSVPPKVKVLDMGLAQYTVDGSVRRPSMGCYTYMPPECFLSRAETPGIAQDLYALGVMLYTFFHNGSLFGSKERAAMERGAHSPLYVRDPALPEGVRVLVISLTSHYPQARGSADELLTKLEDLITQAERAVEVLAPWTGLNAEVFPFQDTSQPRTDSSPARAALAPLPPAPPQDVRQERQNAPPAAQREKRAGLPHFAPLTPPPSQRRRGKENSPPAASPLPKSWRGAAGRHAVCHGLEEGDMIPFALAGGFIPPAPCGLAR